MHLNVPKEGLGYVVYRTVTGYYSGDEDCSPRVSSGLRGDSSCVAGCIRHAKATAQSVLDASASLASGRPCQYLTDSCT